MPLINTGTYDIDFFVIENDDPKSITLLDRSNYLEAAKHPKISIVFPGEIHAKSMKYNPNTIVVIDSVTLGETDIYSDDDLKDLPDGVYKIRMAVCPYEELFKELCYLKTSEFDCKFENFLLTIDDKCCIDNHKLNRDLIEIEILIKSAKAEAKYCHIKKAATKYAVANDKLNQLIKIKNNCF